MNLFCHLYPQSFLPEPADEAGPREPTEPSNGRRRTVVAVLLIVLLILAAGLLCYVSCRRVAGGDGPSAGMMTAVAGARHGGAGYPPRDSRTTSCRTPSSISTPLCQE